MPRLSPADRGTALAGGGAFLAAGVVLVAAGILGGLLLTGLLPLPFTGHDRIGLVPVAPVSGHPGQHHPGPAQPAAPAPAIAGPPPPHAAVPVPARAVSPPHPHPLAPPRPQHAHPGCQRGECKRPPSPLPARAQALSSLYVLVSSLSQVPPAGPLPVPSLPPALP